MFSHSITSNPINTPHETDQVLALEEQSDVTRGAQPDIPIKINSKRKRSAAPIFVEPLIPSSVMNPTIVKISSRIYIFSLCRSSHFPIPK